MLFTNEMQVISLTSGAEENIYIFKLAGKIASVSFLDEEKHVLPCLISVSKTGSGKKRHIVQGTTTPAFLAAHSLLQLCESEEVKGW